MPQIGPALISCPGIVRISDKSDRSGRASDTQRRNPARLRRAGLAEILIGWAGMQPRQVLPNQFYMIPPELGPAAAVLSELRARVRVVEAERAAERQRTGGRVCGRRAMLAQSWRGQPTSREPRRNLRPRVAAQNKWARIEALLRNRAFVEAYTTARAAWREGIPAVFRPGPYWLWRFAQVAVAET